MFRVHLYPITPLREVSSHTHGSMFPSRFYSQPNLTWKANHHSCASWVWPLFSTAFHENSALATWAPESRTCKFITNRHTQSQGLRLTLAGVEIQWEEAGSVTAPTPLWSTGGGCFWPPWVGNSCCHSLLTYYFQSWLKSFTHFNIPAAHVFFIHSHPYRLSFPKSVNPICHDSDMFLGSEPFFFKYKPNGISSHQLLNCNQNMFINDVNIFTAFLYKRNVHQQPQKLDSSEPFPRLYGTINAYGLLCLFNFALAWRSLIFLGI